MKIINKILKIVITLLIVGAIVLFAIKSIKNKKEAIAQIPVMKSYDVIVSGLKVKKKTNMLTLPYFGVIKSNNANIIASKFPARITSIVKSGSFVKKGQVIIKLDTTDFQDKEQEIALKIDSTKVAIEAKRTQLGTLKASHSRTQELLSIKGASQEQFDRERSAIRGVEASIKTLKNKIKILKINLLEIKHSLSYKNIKSTQNGIISKTFANIGDMAMPGKPLLAIEGEGGKYLLVKMAKKEAKEIVVEGKEYPLVSLNHTSNGLLEYRVNIKSRHIDGERVNLSLITYKGVGIKVPLNALLQTEGKNYCFVVHNKRAEAREVKILARGEDGVIVDNLKEAETIVIAKPDTLLQILGGKTVKVISLKEQ